MGTNIGPDLLPKEAEDRLQEEQDIALGRHPEEVDINPDLLVDILQTGLVILGIDIDEDLITLDLLMIEELVPASDLHRHVSDHLLLNQLLLLTLKSETDELCFVNNWLRD